MSDTPEAPPSAPAEVTTATTDRPLPRTSTPPGGTPSLPVAPCDPWRDRIRTAFDRVIYLAALGALVYLRVRDRLDVGSVAAILLVAGIRPHTILDALNSRGAARAGVVLPVGWALWARHFVGT